LVHCNAVKRLSKLDSVAGSRHFLSAFGYRLALFLSYVIASQSAADQIAMRLFIWAEESATLRAEKRHECPTEATE
jgi:hypothetical protein